LAEYDFVDGEFMQLPEPTIDVRKLKLHWAVNETPTDEIIAGG